MCGIPYDHTAPVHEYVAYAAYAENSRGRKPQHLERAAGVANDARLQPSDTTVTPGLGGVQGGSVVPFLAGHSVLVHGMVSRRATAETPKIQAPAQRYNRACRMERCAGWVCRATLAGQL